MKNSLRFALATIIIFAGTICYAAKTITNVDKDKIPAGSAVSRVSSAILTSLAVFPNATLTKVAGPDDANFTATEPNNVDRVQLIANAQDAQAHISATNVTLGSTISVISGTLSPFLPLQIGDNVININVTAVDGVTKKVYSITVTRLKSSVATLSDLAIVNPDIALDPGPLNPFFDIKAYVKNTVASVQVKPVASESTATIFVNNVPVISGSASNAIPLNAGQVTEIVIAITSPDGTNTISYHLFVGRAGTGAASNANLSSIKLSPYTPLTATTGSADANFITTVPYSQTNVTITCTAAQPGAILARIDTVSPLLNIGIIPGSPDGPLRIDVGDNVFYYKVISPDRTTTHTYGIHITRTPSSVATLSGVLLSDGSLSPAFNANTLNYTVTVPNSDSSFYVVPSAASSGTVLKVNGIVTISGYASQNIRLNTGNNTIRIGTTSQDGANSKMYTVIVKRQASAVTTLSNLTLSTGLLGQVFNPATVAYTAKVSNVTTSLTLTPVASATGEKIKVNGVAVLSGSASEAISLNVGANTITTTVTAENGTNMRTYTMVVTRVAAGLSNNTDISLQLSPNIGYVLTTGPADFNYLAIALYNVKFIRLIAPPTDMNATVTVNGLPLNAGFATPQYAVPVGKLIFNIKVTAADCVTSKTIIMTVAEYGSPIATLSNLMVSSGVLTPGFAPGTTHYSVDVPGSTTVFNVTPTATSDVATLTVNGESIPSGTGSKFSPITSGDNFFRIDVTAQNGKSIPYFVTVHKAPSSIATLSDLKLSGGVLSPPFKSTRNSYTATVPNSISSITVSPQATDNAASITVNGNPVASGGISVPVALSPGANTITTVVKSPDGANTQTYTVTVTRAASNASDITSLSKIALSTIGVVRVAEGPGDFNYVATVSYNDFIESLTLIPVDYNETIKVNGAAYSDLTLFDMKTGSNTFDIIVTAPDGITSKRYFINVTKLPSNVASLGNLTFNAGNSLNEPVYETRKHVNITVHNSDTNIRVMPMANSIFSVIKINGVVVKYNTFSNPIPLKIGKNDINIVVTAEDGVTVEKYSVTVNRLSAGLSSSALLTSIKTNPFEPLTLQTSQPFPRYYFYQVVYMPAGTTTFTITAVAQSPAATIKINGVPIASGATSPPLPLDADEFHGNDLSITCTSEDKVETITYIVTLRPAPANMNDVYTPAPVGNGTDGVSVRAGLSPNGDGRNDVLTIDGIDGYADNTLIIMDKGGSMAYRAKGYNNTSVVFDGHSSTTGRMLPAGTYFYSLDYKMGSETKHKTGYILLRY